MDYNQESPLKESIGNIQRDFLYGLFVIIPMVFTVWFVVFSISFISGPVSVFLGEDAPSATKTLISFVLTLILIWGVGLMTRHYIGKTFISVIENILNRIPVISRIYRSVKQIVTAFTLNNKKILSTVLVEYPRKGMWALGFLTKKNASGLKEKGGTDFGEGKCAIFVPTTPNPTSGYFIYVKQEDLIYLDLSVEEGVKVLMSAGVFTPS